MPGLIRPGICRPICLPSFPRRTTMDRPLPSCRLALALAFFGAGAVVATETPTFYLIEPYVLGGFLLHFDTQADRRYDLQYSTNLLSDPRSPRWTSFDVVDAVTFDNHYVILDPETNNVVPCYRFVVTP